MPGRGGAGPGGPDLGGGAWCSGAPGLGGGRLVPGDAWWRPPQTVTPAGGTHPTGMHSCYCKCECTLR